MTCQKPTPQALKKLLTQKDHSDHELILKFYLEFVLSSEILDNEREKSSQTTSAFYFNNEEPFHFNQLCFLRFYEKGIEYIDNEEPLYYQKKDANNQLYYKNSQGWWLECQREEYTLVDIDELYFRTSQPKQARKIEVYVLKGKPSYVKEQNPNVFKNRKTNSFPIGVKQSYKAFGEPHLVFYLDKKGDIRSILSLESKSEFTQKARSSLVYKDGKKVTQKALKNFKTVELKEGYFYYGNHLIVSKKLFYMAGNEPKSVEHFNKERNEKIIFSASKVVYRFTHNILYESTAKESQGELRGIGLKLINQDKKKKEWIFEKSTTKLFHREEEQLEAYEYGLKLVEYGQPFVANYRVLHKKKREKKLSFPKYYGIEDVHRKECLSIGGVDVSIYQKGSVDLERFELKANQILMVAHNKIACDYFSVLYRFRNAIAHAGFKINKDEVFFCNRDNNFTMMRARISQDVLRRFMEKLQGEVWR